MTDTPPFGGPPGTALLERRELFEPDPTSPGRARRLVREVLSQVHRETWAEAAELAVSEVVTNATLHAHTRLEVHLAVFEDEVCVEVRDENPLMPVVRDYDDHATTGRGMGLVAAISRACGTRSLGPDGKVVWFCVGERPTAGGVEDFGWDDADWDLELDGEEPPAEQSVELVLPDMPATLWLSAGQHHDALLRELILYSAEHAGIDADFAAAEAADAAIGNALRLELERAQAEGRSHAAVPGGHPSPLPPVPPSIDLRLSIRAGSVADYSGLQDLLDLAESLAVEGKLLASPGLPEIIAVRDWACEQVIAQASGGRPGPWPGTAQERFETSTHGRTGAPDWDATVVTESTKSVIAADDANRIVAISASLAETLGWRVDDLVGRRVVAVIPPELREAHVAGFTRHLTTGEAHVLGVPLELPVLRKDGTRIQCRFLVEQASNAGGRAVYLAWIDPIEVSGTA